MSKIHPDTLADRLNRGEQVYVLDIRPESQFQAEYIDGSHNIPVYVELRKGNDDVFIDQLGDVPKDADVVTVCKAGIVAKRATRLLEVEGYTATTLAGGFRGWRGYQTNSLEHRVRTAVRNLF